MTHMTLQSDIMTFADVKVCEQKLKNEFDKRWNNQKRCITLFLFFLYIYIYIYTRIIDMRWLRSMNYYIYIYIYNEYILYYMYI